MLCLCPFADSTALWLWQDQTAIRGEDGVVDKSDKYWQDMAARRVLSFVTLIAVEQSSEAQLADRLRACNLGSGVPGRSHVAFVYDANANSESITAPDLRGSPFQQKYYQKVVNACRKCRCDAETMKLAPGDVVLMSDGGKHGDLPALLCVVC